MRFLVGLRPCLFQGGDLCRQQDAIHRDTSPLGKRPARVGRARSDNSAASTARRRRAGFSIAIPLVDLRSPIQIRARKKKPSAYRSAFRSRWRPTLVSGAPEISNIRQSGYFHFRFAHRAGTYRAGCSERNASPGQLGQGGFRGGSA